MEINMIEKITTENAPKAIGPYSQAIKFQNLIYTSGQIAVDPESGEMVGDNITVQAEQVIKNIISILEAADSKADNIIKTTCFLADIADFAKFNEVYSKYITSYPARSCVAVKNLPKNALVEIEVVAVTNQ